MMWHGLLFLLLLFSLVGAQECITEADCPQNKETPFCAGAFCISGYCTAKPPPCSTQCSETLKACVGCEENSDCIGSSLGTICDRNLHVCRPCYDMFDCPEGDYCHGGPWDCFGGKCISPTSSRYPCTDPRQCHEATRSCIGCVTDAQCGAYDFCTNNRFCNTTSGLCDGIGNGNRMCESHQMHCDSRKERCVQCRVTDDCRILDPSFCAPTLICAQPGQYCRPAVGSEAAPYFIEQPPLPPCNQGEQIEMCDEDRKMCVPKICIDENECQDGNECNGRERCLAGTCARPAQGRRSCPEDHYCSGDSGGTVCAIECLSLNDCAELAYVCKKRDVGGADGIKTLCVPCHTDAECQNGIAEDGFETCDQASGKCLAGVSPCRGAPPGSVYDPRTGLCAPPLSVSQESVGGEDVIIAATAVVDAIIDQAGGFPWVKMIITVIGIVGITVLVVIITSPVWAASKWQLWKRRVTRKQAVATLEDDGAVEETLPEDQIASDARLFSRAPQFSGREPIDEW